MDIVAIEGNTFEQMKQRFEHFIKQIREICKEEPKDKWLDNQDVCQLLHISKRTLQSYRDRGILSYAQIGHKCYYKSTDVNRLISDSLTDKNQ